MSVIELMQHSFTQHGLPYFNEKYEKTTSVFFCSGLEMTLLSLSNSHAISLRMSGELSSIEFFPLI